MTFKKEICRNHYLSDTQIENIFIDEYLPDAPGEFVKVYIYAYMYSGINQIMNNNLIAKRLGMNVEDILAAWTYWESVGIIKKYYPDPEDETHYDVEFINIKNAISRIDETGEADHVPAENIRSELVNEDLAKLYKEIESITGRLFDPANALKIAELIDEGADPSIISYAYRYCKESNKTTDFKYVASIVRKWLENNKDNVKDIKAFIEQTDNRMAEQRQIMKALGLNFSAITDEERKVFNSWLDDMGFSLAYILEVSGKAAGMNNKFSYVRKVLENEYEKLSKNYKNMPKKAIVNNRQKYYEQIRTENGLKTKKRRAEVYKKIPQMESIEKELRSLGMEQGKILISGQENKTEALDLIKRSIRNKQEEKEEILVKEGFSKEYMEDIYSCYKCKDTGILDDGVHCSCFAISKN